MKAVILAGGRGRRLAPYTTILPKPLMPVGDLSILDIVLRQLGAAGFDEITLAVGYLAELIMAYLGDGARLGLQLRYSREETPLGTAGPLGLVQGLDEPFLVMNGDLLTTLDYRAMWEAHRAAQAVATLATFRRSVKIDLGVIETDRQGHVARYLEKPVYDYQVSTGIYVFDPDILRYIPAGQRLDLPDLISRLLAEGYQVATYPFKGYWLDIGRPDDYEQAVREFERNPAQFLPDAGSREAAVGHSCC